ncbi:MAG: hypothetical protein EOO61_19030 [Hymenobacter sp.]|nr:MAG: hypothetical protein EOO61_19030 [Hymenobacter sp.]
MSFFSNRPLYWLVGFAGLTACQEKTVETVQLTDKQESTSKMTAQPMASKVSVTSLNDSANQQLVPLLGGAWINTTYAAYLRKTHSPRQSDGHWGSSGITEMLLDPQSYKGDSMAMSLGASNHEGLPLRYVHLRRGPVLNSWSTTAEESGSEAGLLETSLRYHVNQADTLLYLDQRQKNTHRVTTTTFRKLRGVSGTGSTFDEGLTPFINGLLFTGSHLVTDSTGHTYPVRLLVTGQVQGWPGYSMYQVNTDFVGPFHELDTVFFDINQKTQQEWAFIRQGDTVRLYAVQDDTVTYKRQRGRLCYTLVRQSK